jgi:hypothetical protein
MRLVRNEHPTGRGKYMLVVTRKLDLYAPSVPFETNAVLDAVDMLIEEGVVDDPPPETEGEFFVLRLKDRNARPALLAYAASVATRDPEFAAEVRELADRSGELSPFCKDPD